MKKQIILMLTLLLVLFGCQKEENKEETTQKEDVVNDMFTDRDFDDSYVLEEAVAVTFKDSSISCNSDAVQVEGTKITLLEANTYYFTGSLSDGMIVVDCDEKDKIQLVFENISIVNENIAPLYIKMCDKVFVTLVENSTNTFAVTNDFVTIDENNIDGAIFSKQDLTFNGKGKLKVSSYAGHGIVCKDDLVFTGGTYRIESSSHGMDVNDSIRITSSTFDLTAGKDGMHCENEDNSEKGFVYIQDGTFVMEVEGDGIDSSNYIHVKDGKFNILSGGGYVNSTKETSDNWGGFPGGGRRPQRPDENNVEEVQEDSTSIKGIKANADILLENGKYEIDSADDAIHSNASIEIKNGSFTLASGDDGIHADDTLTIKKGNIDISTSYEGLEALNIKIEDGEIAVVASDDGLNAAGGMDQSGQEGNRRPDTFSSGNGSIVIDGGDIFIEASGDGIDANGTLTINGGKTVVCGPTKGDTATLDYDKTAEINGGTFIGTGASGMAQTFSASTQGVFAIQVGNASAYTSFSIYDASGNEIITHAPILDYSVIIVSTEDMKKKETYTIKIGEASGSFEAY